MNTEEIPQLIDDTSPATTHSASGNKQPAMHVHVSTQIPNNKRSAFDYDSEDDDDDDDDEVEDNSEPTTCLFCTEGFTAIEPAITHLQEVHHISLASLKHKFCMDQYSYIKLINCIRREQVGADQLVKAQSPFWLDEKYLKPIEYESWLSYDFEAIHTGADLLTNNSDTPALPVECHTLIEQIKQLGEALYQADEDIKKMRESLHSLLSKESDGIKQKPTAVAKTSLEFEKEYFSGYAHFGIHHEMLADEVRTTSYRDVLLNNADFVKGKTVLDVGCGTAVLSIFASRAGASQVVGIDNSEIIFNAMGIIKLNKIENVTLVKGRLEDTELPLKKFDIIISEWMGYFLFFEGMLDSIIYARDHHLKPGGVILPTRCTLSLIGYGSDELYARHIGFWDDVYGVNMSNMRGDVLREPLVDVVDAEYILTEATIMSDVNMVTADLNYSNFTHSFELKCTKSGTLSAFVGYFDTFFDLPHPAVFGTGPKDKPTHWKQVVFFIEHPRVVQANEVVSGKFVCRRLRENARSLDVVIEVFNKRHTYYLD